MELKLMDWIQQEFGKSSKIPERKDIKEKA